MTVLENKLQTIYNKLNTLILQFKKICVKNLNGIPVQIDEIIVGQDRLKMYFDKSINYEINKDDLKYIKEINSYRFYNCTNLTSVTIPDSVTTIGDYAFYGCDSLSNITIPDSVTNIGSSAFQYCKSLTDIIIPNSITNIANQAFGNCKNLTKIVIPNSVTTIQHYAFWYNDNLASAIIPESVTSIGPRVFFGCPSLIDVYMHSATPPTLGDSEVFPTTTTIHVPIGSGDAYKNATNWSSFADKIVEDIEI